MAESTTETQYRIEINVDVPKLQGTMTRVRRWVLANKAVHDAHGNQVAPRQPKR